MALTGDFRKLELAIRGFDLLGSSGRASVVLVVAQGLDTLIQDGFNRGRAPNGRPWKPIKPYGRRQKGDTPLNDTGRLRRNVHVDPNMGGVLVHTDVVYAARHNFGGTFRHRKRGRSGGYYEVTTPKREFVPSTMPPAWARKLTHDANGTVRRLLGRV